MPPKKRGAIGKDIAELRKPPGHVAGAPKLKKKEESVESILDFLKAGAQEMPKKRKEEEDDEELLFLLQQSK